MSRKFTTVSALFFSVVLLVTACTGAGGGDPVSEGGASKEQFYAQKIGWNKCDEGFECASVRAPLDWDNPEQGKALKLALVRLPAKSGKPLGTLFVNPGGPGGSGIEYAFSTKHGFTEEILRNYNILGWDPRGVGASTSVDCLSTRQADEYIYRDKPVATVDNKDEFTDDMISASKKYGQLCKEDAGDLLPHVDTDSTVRDLDMLRELVGDKKLSYYGASYGTYIGSEYARLFPKNISRMVLDGVVDSTLDNNAAVIHQAKGFQNTLRLYVEACLQREDCPLPGPVDAALAQTLSLTNQVEGAGMRSSDGRVLNVAVAQQAVSSALYNESLWPLLDDMFRQLPAGDATAAFKLADIYYQRTDGRYMNNMIDAYNAINCADRHREKNIDPIFAAQLELNRVAPNFAVAMSEDLYVCEGWPIPNPAPRAPYAVADVPPILLVGATGDSATPYAGAVKMHGLLPGSALLTVHDETHVSYDKEHVCVAKTVDAYLLEGKLPGEGVSCEI